MRKLCASMFMQSYSRNKGGFSPDSFTTTKAAELDNFYQYHVDFDSQSEESHAPRFREILDIATSLLVDEKSPKMEAHLAGNAILMLDILAGKFAPGWEDSFKEAFREFRERLQESRQQKSHEDPYWYRYGAISSGGATDKVNASLRYRFFEEEMFRLMSPLTRLDSKRAYTPEER